MRLINANRAISRVDEIPLLTDKNQAFFEGCRYMKKRVLKVLRTSKTIDAVPVVRCRDCKHFLEKGGILEPWCDWHEARLFCGDGFCADGERKGGAE